MKRILVPIEYNKALLIDAKDTIQMFHILSRAREVLTSDYSDDAIIQPAKKMVVTLIDDANIVESKPEPEAPPKAPALPAEDTKEVPF